MSTTRDELLTVDQVLDELGGVSRRTFFRWRELGRAPQCVKLPTENYASGAATYAPGFASFKNAPRDNDHRRPILGRAA